MADEQTVLVSRDEHRVATVTLNRPEKLNAMTPAMQQRYCQVLAELDADPQVRAIVVTGAGRGFCAGADLAVLDDVSAAGFTDDTVDLGAPMALSTPVIAAVNGPVAGMGFAYLLMADVRYASQTARIGSTFARLGLVAEWGCAALLPGIVGTANAADLLLSARIIDAAEALRIGLVQKVCAPERLLEDATAWARDVAVHTSPRSHAAMKAQLRDAGARAGFDESVRLMLESFSWPDLPEALAARAAQRPPDFPPA